MSAEDWTEERIALMRRLRCVQGLSAGDIAKALSLTGHSFTRNAVIGKLIRLGIDAPAHLRQERGRKASGYKTRQRNAAKPKIKKLPEFKSTPHKPKGAVRGPHNIKFITRSDSHCPMFCEGEEGPDGLVCGKRAVRAGYCCDCYSLVYVPVRERAAA